MRKAVFILALATLAFLAACQRATPTPQPEPTEAPAATEAPAMEEPMAKPSIEVQDQEIMDGKVVIARVVSEGPGWVVIHVEKDGKPGPIIGYAPVQAGENTNVEVEIDAEKATETLFAMLHVDAGQQGKYDDADVSVKVDGQVVVKPFKVKKGMMEESMAKPYIEVQDQEIMDGKVVIARVVSEGPGWVVIHVEKDGKPGPIIGYAPVQAGENTNVEVEIDTEKATETLFAMLHVDAGQQGKYDDADVSVKVDGQVVVKAFKVKKGMMEGDMGYMGGETVEVAIVNYTFEPMELTIKVGTTVTWENKDAVPHTVTADNGAFDSGRMNQGDKFSFTFNEPGTYTYICDIHPYMKGTITVTE